MTEESAGDAVAADVPPLRSLYLYLTEGCNLACRHCYLAPRFDANGDRYATMPVELLEEVLAEAKPLGLNTVKLTGGEPLLHPRILDILALVRREDLVLVMESNGVLCSPEIARSISECRQPFVSISIDGAVAETHEAVRGVAGSFAKSQSAVRMLVERGVPTQIIMSVMESNYREVEPVVRMAEELGAESVKFNVVQPTSRGEKLHASGDVLDIARLIDLGRWVDNDLSRTTKLRLAFDYPMAFASLRRISQPGRIGVCGIMGILGLLPTGHYALCGMGERAEGLVFGRAGEDELASVWNNNSTLRDIRSRIPGDLRGVCSECLMRDRCLGACVAQTYYRTGTLWEPFWFCEQAREAGLFPQSRLSTAQPQ